MNRNRIHKNLTLIIQGVLLIGTLFSIIEGNWQLAFFTFLIIIVSLAPVILGKRFHVFIPPEFEFLATIFVFGTLFLGEVKGYYIKFWWWDLVLHTASGFLLGIVGFLLVHVLNEKKEIRLHMTPGFVALFAFMFAVGIGALWEIFEFSMDQLFGLDMQKAMWTDPSGLTDTMWDLIVDSVGALVISVLGYGYLKKAGNQSFLENWIHAFIESNPRLFGRNKTE